MGRIGTGLAAAALAVGLTAGLARPGQAGDSLVVVELFTSQGCSSCPPADALISRLAARDDVLPLALHVDYWDYIGWKDDFASPAFTARQKAYAHAAGERTVYTPQMIVGGQDHVIGTREMELGELIMEHGARPPAARLSAARSGAEVRISAEAAGGAALGPVLVQLVRFNPEETVEILRGENAGRTITYSNIVTEWHVVGRWSGNGSLEMTAPMPGALPAAVILQRDGPGAILAAAVVR